MWPKACTNHGFAPTGVRYTPVSIRQFQTGVAARMNRLVQHALERRQQIKAGQCRFYGGTLTVVLAYADQWLGQPGRFVH